MTESSKMWNTSSECFTSVPVYDNATRELWFTPNHTHDKGSVEHGFKYLIPIF